MKSLFLFLTLVCAFGIVSCDIENMHTVAPYPEDSPNKPDTTPVRVKYYISEGDTTTYHYDTAGRLKKSVNSDGSYRTVTYGTNKIEESWFDKNGSIQEFNTYHLNEKGLCTKYVESGNPRQYDYEYDTDGHLVHQIIREGDGSQHSEWWNSYMNGNLVKDSTYRYQQQIWRVYNYEDYYTDIRNTIHNENYGRKQMGKGSLNYIKRRVYTSSIGELSIVDYLPPTLDAKGRITERTYIVNNSDSPAYTRTESFVYY